MMDMPTLMSKLLAIGMPLKEIFARSTWTPAQTIGHPELGHLSVGAEADISAFRLLDGAFQFRDEKDGAIKGTQRLIPELTVKAGKVVWDWNSRSGVDYQTLPSDYGVRPGMDVLVRPQM
jgi:dihydroorotase